MTLGPRQADGRRGVARLVGSPIARAGGGTAAQRWRWRLPCRTWRSGTCSGGCPMPRSQQAVDDKCTGGRAVPPRREVRRSTCLRNLCATSSNELACWNILSVNCVARTANCGKHCAPPVRKLCDNLTLGISQTRLASKPGTLRGWLPFSGTPTGSCPVVGLGRDGHCGTGEEMMCVIAGNAP